MKLLSRFCFLEYNGNTRIEAVLFFLLFIIFLISIGYFVNKQLIKMVVFQENIIAIKIKLS